MEIKKILNEDFDYESDSWDDGEVEQGKSFFEDGYDWKWMRRVGDVEHLDFDNWAVWMAFRPEDENNIHGRNVVAFFIVDEDTGFIDWGPCDTYEEAKEFLDSKVQDWENDTELDEAWEPTFSDAWKPEDIELWKSIDWKARNYRPYTVEDDTFEGEVTAYGLPGGEQKATVTFAKELSPNSIYEPVYKPTSNPFEGTVGFMYDGNKHDGYLVMDRTETQEVYDMLSESEEDKPYTKKQILDELKRETKNFTLEKDTIKYGFKEEAFTAEEILNKHYESVELDKVGSWYQIDFKGLEKKNVKEDLNDPDEILTLKRDINLAGNEDEIQLLIYNLSDGAAEDIVQQAYDENESNDLETLKAAVITAIDVYLEDNEWLGESKSINEADADIKNYVILDAELFYDIVSNCDEEELEVFNKLGWISGNSVVIPEGTKLTYHSSSNPGGAGYDYYYINDTDDLIGFSNIDSDNDDVFDNVEKVVLEESIEDESINEDFNKYRDEEGHLLADKWYASVYPDDEIGIEQLQGITLDDALKDRSILDHCDTQVKDRVYKQLDKYSPIISECKSIEEDFSDDYIYLFPELTDDDIKMMAGYNIKYLGMNHGPDGSEDNWVAYGRKEDIEKYAEKYLGYELHPDYLYEYDDFAGEIINESVTYPNGMEVRDDSVDMDKALDYQFGTDRDPDINSYTEDEKQRAIDYWIEKTDGFSKQIIDEDSDYKYTMIEDYVGEELDKDDIIEWLSEHEQAYEDAQAFFMDVPLKDVPQDELVSWIEDHDQLYRDFIHYFYQEKGWNEDNLD